MSQSISSVFFDHTRTMMRDEEPSNSASLNNETSKAFHVGLNVDLMTSDVYAAVHRRGEEEMGRGNRQRVFLVAYSQNTQSLAFPNLVHLGLRAA